MITRSASQKWRWCNSSRSRLWAIALSALLGLFSVLGFSWISTPSVASVVVTAPTPLTSQSHPEVLLQQGIDAYDAERFAEAIAYWQQALTHFTTPQTSLNQALTLHYLSLGYQQLGQEPAAEQAIAASLTLLQQEPSETLSHREIWAKALNTQGRLYWMQGQTEAALTTWQQAAIAYEEAADEIGLVMVLINQANALQVLGFNVQAQQQLQQIESRLYQQTDPSIKAIGLRSLGNAFRRVGDLPAARGLLQASFDVGAASNLTPLQSSTMLDLGNLEWDLAERAMAIGKVNVAQGHIATANQLYYQAENTATSPLVELQARLNRFSLLVNTATEIEQDADVRQLVQSLSIELATLPPSRSAINAQLNFVHNLFVLRDRQRNMADHLYTSFVLSFPNPDAHTLFWSPPAIAQFLTQIVQQSQQLQDTISESYALGQLGELYERNGQWLEAQSFTEQALFKLEDLHATEARYLWEWQLGRLRTKQADREGAIAFYTEAIHSLDSIRKDLLLINTNVQFSLRDRVEPVYREFIDLLLTPENGNEPSQADLKQAIQQIDALQLAEIENFLGCDLAQMVTLSDVEVDPSAVKIYPMLLPQRLVVVLELPGQGQSLLYHETLKSRQEVTAIVQQLRYDLSKADRTPAALMGLQEVYRWIIEPFRAILANSNEIETLVFVPDGVLRNIPLSALHDGHQYLISTYAVALAPKLDLFYPNPRPARLNVFLGGMGEAQTLNNQNFPKIEYLTSELESIQNLVNANQLVLNQSFTKENLKQHLQSQRFNTVHLKTHGVFSSDPESTFIVAYQELITSQDLGQLLQTNSTQAETVIELLVLSACSTAAGDNRAVLGLAGTAIQAGAHSVISTLWEAQDVPNTQLMIQFYRELLHPKTSRAQALRKAQLHLFNQGYQTPHIWATYVLVGNWL